MRVSLLICGLILGIVAGCATCGTCQGAAYHRPKWRAVASSQNDQVPPPEGPHARPIGTREADDFATPPVDGPDELVDMGDEEPEPELEVPVRPKKKKARTRLVKETDGGMVIEQHGSGAIYLNSPGVQPHAQTQVPALAAQVPLMAAAPAVPIIPGPFTDAQVFGMAKRVGGGLYYAFTGKCPTFKPKAAVAPAVGVGYVQQTSIALVPQTSYAAVPVQTLAPVQVPVAAAQVPQVYQPLAQVPVSAPAAPVATPTPQTPLASPQSAPRKSLFGLGR